MSRKQSINANLITTQEFVIDTQEDMLEVTTPNECNRKRAEIITPPGKKDDANDSKVTVILNPRRNVSPVKSPDSKKMNNRDLPTDIVQMSNIHDSESPVIKGNPNIIMIPTVLTSIVTADETPNENADSIELIAAPADHSNMSSATIMDCSSTHDSFATELSWTPANTQLTCLTRTRSYSAPFLHNRKFGSQPKPYAYSVRYTGPYE